MIGVIMAGVIWESKLHQQVKQMLENNLSDWTHDALDN